MYCKNCGQLIDDNSAFCKYCGASQGISTKIGIINERTGHSGEVEIDIRMSVSDFVSYLIKNGWIPNHSTSISSLTIRAGQDPQYYIYQSGGNSQNKSTLIDTLADHNSEDVIINYSEPVYIREERHYHNHRGWSDMVCLYGCPSSEKIEDNDEEDSEITNDIF